MFNPAIHKHPLLLILGLSVALHAVGCDSDEDSDTTDATSQTDASTGTGDPGETETSGAPLAIIGNYTDNFAGTHAVTEAQWVQTSEFGVFAFDLLQHDNDVMWVAAEDVDNMGVFSRFDWTTDASGQLYSCQAVFDADSVDAAIAAPRSDDTDPATAGCGGTFPWTALTPA